MNNLMLRVFAVCLLLLAFLIVGCSRHPNEQELKALEEQKQAAAAAEVKATDCGNEKAAMEKQLAEKTKKAEEMKQEKVEVEKRLAEWK
jgi:PBP1b-binding outer membrane lipoprotein LpoB